MRAWARDGTGRGSSSRGIRRQSARAPGWRLGTKYRSLLGPDASFLNDLAPLRHLGLDERAEFIRRVADRLRAEGRQTLSHLRHAQYFHHFAMQSVDDLGRRPFHGNDAVPADHLIARHARFGHGP